MLQSEEWRNENLNRAFPFRDGSGIPDNAIVDACIYLDSPIVLEKIEKSSSNEAKLYLTNGIYWVYNFSIAPEYVYNDFGKLVVNNLDHILALSVGESITYNALFEPSICYPPADLSVMGLTGDITIDGNIDTDAPNIAISLEEQTNFSHTGISQINKQTIANRNLQIIGDSCTQIIMRDGLLAVDDVCLPPCYDCNDRLTAGDVHLTMQDLETRVTNLETP